MKASDWIDQVKTRMGLTSDYAAAAALGINRSMVSKYRNGRTPTLDEDTALLVAKALGERPEAIILDQAAERVHSPEVRAALLDAARRLCILCKIAQQ